MLKVLNCDVHGDLASVSHRGMNPCVSQTPAGTNTQEDSADNRDIRLFLPGCYVLGTWFDRWYIHIPVIMSRV